MQRQLRAALAAFLLLALTLAGFAPVALASPTTATTPYPIANSYISKVTAFDDGGFAATGCYESMTSSTNGLYVDRLGIARNSLSGNPSTGRKCSEQAVLATADGTIYGNRLGAGYDSHMLFSIKNGRQLWATNLDSATNCVINPNWNPSYKRFATSMSQGADGNLYVIVTPEGIPNNCGDALLVIDPVDGGIVRTIELGNYSQSPSYPVQAWTYDDRIVTFAMNGTVREFDYDGIENVAAQYQFSMPSGQQVHHVTANDAGTVFVLTQASAPWAQASLLYHTAAGTNGTSSDSSAGWAYYQPSLGANGSFLGIKPTGAVSRFTTSSSTPSVTTVTPETAGYAVNELSAYYEDADGNAIILWYHATSSSRTEWASSVDVYSASSDTTTNVFLREYKTADPTNHPPFWLGATNEGIANGSLYLSTCEGTPTDCFNSSAAKDTSIYKVDVSPFDSPIGKGYERNNYESQKLEYVAMGDSFSSGEGVTPFLAGTDKGAPNENRCHRSEDAYPMLLEEDAALELNLTAFVACSGATTSNITGNGQWGEPRQIDALSTSTDIVTLTIGGNDVGFSDVLNRCTYLNDVPPSWVLGQDAYDEYVCLNEMEDAEGKIYGYTPISGNQTLQDAITGTLNAIIGEVDDSTEIYLMGYPYLYPEYEDIEGSCPWGAALGAALTSDRSVSEDEANMIRHVTTLLNTRLSSIVAGLDDERVHYVDSTEEFDGQNICTGDGAYINHIHYGVPAGSYHPNTAGQVAFKAIVKEALN